MILNLIATLIFYLFIIVVTETVGQQLLPKRWLGGFSETEKFILHLSVGLCILAFGPLILGLLGLLSPVGLGLWLLLLLLLSLPQCKALVKTWSQRLQSLRQLAPFTSIERAFTFLVLAMLFLLTLIQAFSPPIGYDALMYHLVAPAQFLEKGRIVLLPDNWPANGPLLPQMLFMYGFAMRADLLARVFHLTWSILLLLSIYAFGKRFLNKGTGALAALVLIGIPIIPLWANLAYADFAWAFFEFMALSIWMIWAEDCEADSLMILTGLFLGLAVSSKYLAWGQVFTILVLTLWRSRKESVYTVIRRLMLLSATVLLLCSPWYIKNLILSGNPIYPFVFGGPGWPASRVASLVAYHRSFSTGTALSDYISLPFNLYLRYQRFGTYGGTIEIPSLLFPLALFYPLTKRKPKLSMIAMATTLRFLLWSLTSQQIRHLLPLYPGLCLLTAYVLIELTRSKLLRRWGWVLKSGLTGGMLIASLVYSVIHLFHVNPLGVVLGTESRSAFLKRNVHDYGAVEFITTNLPESSRVFFLWDAQSYYCDDRCIPDTDHNQWTFMVEGSDSLGDICSRLEEDGMTHLLYSESDAAFRLAHDPDGNQHEALATYQSFKSKYTELQYEDEGSEVLRIICGG